SFRLCRAHGSDTEFPRPRRRAADAHLGQYHGRGPAIHARGTLDHRDPRRRTRAHGDGAQPPGRRSAGRARSPTQDPAVTLLSVGNLRVVFGSGERELPAVDDVGFDVAEGEILGIVGESGSGKSVTALSIMGLLPKPPARLAAGSIRFQGRNLIEL